MCDKTKHWQVILTKHRPFERTVNDRRSTGRVEYCICVRYALLRSIDHLPEDWRVRGWTIHNVDSTPSLRTGSVAPTFRQRIASRSRKETASITLKRENTRQPGRRSSASAMYRLHVDRDCLFLDAQNHACSQLAAVQSKNDVLI